MGTKVIDQSLQQTIQYKDSVLIQTIATTNTTTYTISTVTTTATGAGIVLTSGIAATDQVMIYYGGRQLRKKSIDVYDVLNLYNTRLASDSIYTLLPEFSINTSTQVLTLNINETIAAGTRITVMQKQGYIWAGTESVLTSNAIQASFLRIKEAELPDIYYYGGDSTLTDGGGVSLTDDTDEPLQEY